MADIERSGAVVGVVVVELIKLCRVRFGRLNLEPIACEPVAKPRLGTALDAKARGFVVVVDDVGILLGAVVPE